MHERLGGGKVMRIEEPVYGGANGALKIAHDMPAEYWEKLSRRPSKNAQRSSRNLRLPGPRDSTRDRTRLSGVRSRAFHSACSARSSPVETGLPLAVPNGYSWGAMDRPRVHESPPPSEPTGRLARAGHAPGPRRELPPMRRGAPVPGLRAAGPGLCGLRAPLPPRGGAATGSMYISAAVTEVFAAAVALGLFFLTDWSVTTGLLVGGPLVLCFCYAFLPVSIAVLGGRRVRDRRRQRRVLGRSAALSATGGLVARVEQRAHGRYAASTGHGGTGGRGERILRRPLTPRVARRTRSDTWTWWAS